MGISNLVIISEIINYRFIDGDEWFGYIWLGFYLMSQLYC